MEKVKQIVFQLGIIWLSVSLLSIIATMLGLLDVDMESIVIEGAIVSCVQMIIGIKKRYSVTIIPLVGVITNLFFLLPPQNPLNMGVEASVAHAELVSPYITALLYTMIDSFSCPIRKVLIILNCTVFTPLYLFLELSVARYVLLSFARNSKEKVE